MLFAFSFAATCAAADDQEVFYQCFAQQKMDGYRSGPQFCRCVSDLAITRLNPDDYETARTDYSFLGRLGAQAIAKLQQEQPLTPYEGRSSRIFDDCRACKGKNTERCLPELRQARLWSDFQALATNLRYGYFELAQRSNSYRRFFTDMTLIASSACKGTGTIQFPTDYWTEELNEHYVTVDESPKIRMDRRTREPFLSYVEEWGLTMFTDSTIDFFESMMQGEFSVRPYGEVLWLIQLRQSLVDLLGNGCAPGTPFYETYRNMIAYELENAPHIPAGRPEGVLMAEAGIDPARLESTIKQRNTAVARERAAAREAGPLFCNWGSVQHPLSDESKGRYHSRDLSDGYRLDLGDQTLHFGLYPIPKRSPTTDGTENGFRGLGLVEGTACVVRVQMVNPSPNGMAFNLLGHAFGSDLYAPCNDVPELAKPLPGLVKLETGPSASASLGFYLREAPWARQSSASCAQDGVIVAERARLPTSTTERLRAFEREVLSQATSTYDRSHIAPEGFWKRVQR